MNDVVIIDYEIGNLLSVQRAINACGHDAIISNEPEIILSAKKIILPGVGAFPDGMSALKKSGLDLIILEAVKRNIPLMGICLGMQLLFDSSEEFVHTKGLGLIDGEVVKIKNIDKQHDIKIPHIGWAELKTNFNSWEKTILQDIREGEAVYFVHSYFAKTDSANVLAYSEYFNIALTAVVQKGLVWGCQFHPEKSGKIGLKILNQFLKI